MTKEQKALLEEWQNSEAIAYLFEINRRDITQLIERLLEAKDAECEEKKKKHGSVSPNASVSPPPYSVEDLLYDETAVDKQQTIPLSEHKEKMRKAIRDAVETCYEEWVYDKGQPSGKRNIKENLFKEHGLDKEEASNAE